MKDEFLGIITALCMIGTIIATIIWGWLVFVIGIFLTFVIIGALLPDDSNNRVNNKENKQDIISQIGKTELMSDMLGDIRGKKIDDFEKTLISHYSTEEDLFNPFEEEFFCDRCGEQITEEEYIDGAGLCEDCDTDVFLGLADDSDLYR